MCRSMKMKKNTSIWMAALTLTAIVLGVILIAAPQRSAEASMLNSQACFSLMTAGANTTGGDDALIVVDKTQQKIIIYHLNGNKLEVLGGRSYANTGR